MSARAEPVIGVVVPAFDAEPYLAATLASVVAQTWTAWECVVVDDGSRDGTAAVARAAAARDARIRVVSQAGAGPSAARNAGVAALAASVTEVAFLDADDTWLPGALAELHAALATDPGAVGAYGYAENMDPSGAPVDPGAHPAVQRDRRRVEGRALRAVAADEPITFAELVVVGALWPAGVALHRLAVVRGVGGFEESLAYAEDWDLYLRAAVHGHYRPVAGQVAWYRRHPAQLTRSSAGMRVTYELVRRRAFDAAQGDPVRARAARWASRHLQVRRTLRATEQLARAARAGRWTRARRLALGVAVLAAQSATARPGLLTERTARWTDVSPAADEPARVDG